MRMVCAIAFWLFSFSYLFFFQSDILAAGQHVLSKGQTHYNAFIGAVLITLTLYLLQRVVAHFTKLEKRAHALTYFPSLLVLTIITDVSSEIDRGFSFGGWLVAVPLLVAAFVGVAWALRKIEPFEPEPLTYGLTSRNTWINLLTRVVMFLLVGIFSNGDETFHHRMRMEKLIAQGKYDEALKVGRKSLKTDPSLVMLRAHALVRKGWLGERFFDFPIYNPEYSLLPDGENVRTVLLPDSVVTDLAKTPRAKVDYMLMRYLLDRDLRSFAGLVGRIYPDSLMPKHYAEALWLYKYRSEKPVERDVDNVIETDYYDFLQMEKQYDRSVAPNFLRRTFGNTYWYYYKYGRRSESN